MVNSTPPLLKGGETNMAFQSPEAADEKKWEMAWYYVNKWAGNKTQAYQEYYRAHDLPIPSSCHCSAYRFFKDERVKAIVEQLRKENRERYSEMRDNNVAILKDISTDAEASRSERISAIKELNHMMGYGTENINVNGKVDSDIEINIANI